MEGAEAARCFRWQAVIGSALFLVASIKFDTCVVRPLADVSLSSEVINLGQRRHHSKTERSIPPGTIEIYQAIHQSQNEKAPYLKSNPQCVVSEKHNFFGESPRSSIDCPDKRAFSRMQCKRNGRGLSRGLFNKLRFFFGVVNCQNPR